MAAEVIGTPSYSIGGQLYLSKVHLDTAGILAWTAIIILLSLCFEKLMLRLAEKFFEWMPSQERWTRDRKIDSHSVNVERSKGANCETMASIKESGEFQVATSQITPEGFPAPA